MNCRPVCAAIVGAGAISDIYLTNLTTRFSIIEIKAICAAHLENARRKGNQYGIRACSYEEILSDRDIELVINLTPAYVHYDIIKKALDAGKHVYTEKTMTESVNTAADLLRTAGERGLYLACGPDNFLASSLQTARRALDEGLIGKVTSCFAAANRDNDVYTSRYSFLRMPGGGICHDYGVYYVGAMASLLGPIRRAAAFVKAPYKKRINIEKGDPAFGMEIDTPNESQVSAILEFESGITGNLHLNADSVLEDQAYFAIYGTKGILYLPEPNWYGKPVRLLPYNKETGELTDMRVLSGSYAFQGNDRGIGAAELAWSIRTGRPCRASKELAYHILEVLSAIIESGEDGQIQEIHSSCERPAPLKPRGENDTEESVLIPNPPGSDGKNTGLCSDDILTKSLT